MHRTESDRTADGIRLDGGREPIGHRTQSDWMADVNDDNGSIFLKKMHFKRRKVVVKNAYSST